MQDIVSTKQQGQPIFWTGMPWQASARSLREWWLIRSLRVIKPWLILIFTLSTPEKSLLTFTSVVTYENEAETNVIDDEEAHEEEETVQVDEDLLEGNATAGGLVMDVLIFDEEEVEKLQANPQHFRMC